MKRTLRLTAAAAVFAMTGAAGCNKKDPLQTAAPPPSPGAVALPPAVGKRMPGNMAVTGGPGAAREALPGTGK